MASVKFNSNFCVCCGAEIPDSRITCPICDEKAKEGKKDG